MLFGSNTVKLISLIIGVIAVALGIAAFRQSEGETVLAVGRFHPVAHRGSGNVRMAEIGGIRRLKIDQFRTASRPGLVVLLISANDALENETVKNSEKVELGPLLRDEGSLEIELPSDLDLTRFNAVTIWNPEYEVNYATAPLTRTKEKGQ